MVVYMILRLHPFHWLNNGFRVLGETRTVTQLIIRRLIRILIELPFTVWQKLVRIEFSWAPPSISEINIGQLKKNSNHAKRLFASNMAPWTLGKRESTLKGKSQDVTGQTQSQYAEKTPKFYLTICSCLIKPTHYNIKSWEHKQTTIQNLQL